MLTAIFRLGLLGGCALHLAGCTPPDAPALPEVPRSALVLKEGRLYRPAQTEPFSGTVVEFYAPGHLQSRSAISNGVLHGLSEGWHTNGTRQVVEPFIHGVSDGLRLKWYPSGVKQSEARIAGGKLNGTFRRWHENGQLAEQIELRNDQPHGESLAYYPSGCLKARARMADGKALATENFADGEVKAGSAVAAAEAAKPKS